MKKFEKRNPSQVFLDYISSFNIYLVIHVTFSCFLCWVSGEVKSYLITFQMIWGEITLMYDKLSSWPSVSTVNLESQRFSFWSRSQDSYITCSSLLKTKPADAQKAKLNSWLAMQPPNIMGSLKSVTSTRVLIMMMLNEILYSSSTSVI